MKNKLKYQCEGDVNFIIEKAMEDIQSGLPVKSTLELAVLDAYKAGMVAAQKVYTD